MMRYRFELRTDKDLLCEQVSITPSSDDRASICGLN
jgi:hypothetical protein